MVNMGQIAVSKTPGDVLAALGLGSCVAVCAYDPLARTGGMLHVVLPDSSIAKSDDVPGKFADRGVPRLLEELERKGAVKSRLKIAMLGGANVLVSANHRVGLDIGERNIAAVSQVLKEQGFSDVVSDVGGRISRTVRLKVVSGEIVVKTIRGGEILFACLRDSGGH